MSAIANLEGRRPASAGALGEAALPAPAGPAYELFAVWPPDEPRASSTGMRVFIETAFPHELAGAIAKGLRDAHRLGAGLEVLNRRSRTFRELIAFSEGGEPSWT